MVMHAGGLGNATSVSSAAFPLLGTAGNAAAPTYSFTGQTSDGMYSRSTNILDWTINGTAQLELQANIFQIHSAGLIGFCSGAIGVGSIDTYLSRDTAATLALKNANTAQEFRVYGGNGSYVSPIKSVNETLTIANAASTDSATTIPAGSVVIACAVRVLTAIPTAANFTMTTATGGTTMSTAPVLVAANTTDKGTAGGVFYQSANTKVRITPNATPGNSSGSVRLCIYYYDTVAPTS